MTRSMRPLGTSGLRITTLGFGSWAAGGAGWSFGWGPQDDERSASAKRPVTACTFARGHIGCGEGKRATTRSL